MRQGQVFTLGESLGGVESLIEHPGRMTHASVAGTDLEVPSDLIRLSVGIETVEDLLADLDRAPGMTYLRRPDPDIRFSLANERTFLAWVRTAIGLVAAGVAIFHLIDESGRPRSSRWCSSRRARSRPVRATRTSARPTGRSGAVSRCRRAEC